MNRPQPLPAFTGDLVDRLVAANAHLASGFVEKTYRGFWPDVVPRPPWCAEGHDLVLVDRDAFERGYKTLAANVLDIVRPSQLRRQPHDREQMRRYALFVRASDDRRGWKPEAVTLGPREKHLDAEEGFFAALTQPSLVGRVTLNCLASTDADEPTLVACVGERRGKIWTYTRDAYLPAKHHVYATLAHVAPVF